MNYFKLNQNDEKKFVSDNLYWKLKFGRKVIPCYSVSQTITLHNSVSQTNQQTNWTFKSILIKSHKSLLTLIEELKCSPEKTEKKPSKKRLRATVEY